MKKTLLFRLFVLAAAMMCALGTNAAEAYACYTTSNTTLTFYYDNYRSSRTGTTYDLNTGATDTGWDTDGINVSVTKVVFDPSFAGARPTSTYDWFYEMWNLESITGMSYLNTSEVTNMGYMFPSCSKLTSLDLSSFNTSKVTDMRYMFYGCRNLRTIYVGSGWSTVAVTNSSYMFQYCTSLVGGQGTTYDDNHIDKAYAHIDGGPSNPGYFTDINPVEGYACYTPENTTLTFYYDNQRSSRTGTTYSLNTGSTYPAWYTDGTNANVTKVVFNSSFANARPTTTGSWFQNMENLQSITGMNYLNTSEVTYMAYMFFNCSGLTGIDLSHFNTSRVTTMRTMFGSCQALESLDLSSFNTSQVTNMGYMFSNCTNLRTIYAASGWSTAAVTYSSNMFEGCTSLVGGQGTTWSSSNPKDKTYAHIDGGSSNPGYFTAEGQQPWTDPEPYACYTPSNTTLTFYYDNQRSSRTGTTYDLNTGSYDTDWDTDGTNYYVTKVVFDPSFADARPTTTCDWFYRMQNLESITGMSYLNTSEVTNMNWMFMRCEKLTNLDVSYFNTSKVTNMSAMFRNCNSLTSLDLSSFNTSKVTNMSYMLYGCTNLRTIYVDDGWSTAAVTSSTDMFLNCSSLVGGQGTTYDANHVDKTYAHIDGGPSNPGYFTDKNAGQRGDVDGDGDVSISDVSLLIDYLLSGSATDFNLAGADADQDCEVGIADASAIIDYLLSGSW
jgi:surface protein